MNVLDKFLNKLSDEIVINLAEKLGISDWDQGHGNIHYRGCLWRELYKAPIEYQVMFR